MYYKVNASDPSRSNFTVNPKVEGPNTCGQDLIDEWPWNTKWVGKGGAEVSWISHMQVPFAKSLRVRGFNIPPDLARADIDSDQTLHSNVGFRGVEGKASELGVELGAGVTGL